MAFGYYSNPLAYIARPSQYSAAPAPKVVFATPGDTVARYGALAPARSPTAEPNPLRKHRQLNASAALITLLMPACVFIGTCWCFAFSLRFQEPYADLFIAIVGGFAVLACAGLVIKARQHGRMNNNPREATWYWALFWTMLCAWGLGMLFGEFIYQTYMQNYYKVSSLNTYAGVSPGKSSGSQLLDAGYITFEYGTYLDRSRMASYKQGVTYCVSPIVPPPQPPYVDETGANGTQRELRLSSYDFWAVGKGCCGDQENMDFLCGEYNNPYARSGLRAVMSEGDKDLFKQAVKHAEGNFGIQAQHPLFLYWMQDPVAEVAKWQDTGFKYFLGVSFTFCGMQTTIVVLTLSALLKDYVP